MVIADYKNGCSDTERIHIRYISDAVITLTDSVTIYPGESYQMNPQGNCLYYHWFPPLGLTQSNISNPVATPPVNTRYFVTGTTEWGCKVRDSIDVYVAMESLLDVPNAFTPGSEGPNHILRVIRRGEASLKSFVIFNRWGNKVFETHKIDEGWNGRYNGVPQPMGVYVYMIEAEYNSGRRFYRQGNITLIR
jgi:gliding motility-associated-like protein